MKHRLSPLFVAVAFVLLAASSAAGKDKWLSLRTKNFNIVSKRPGLGIEDSLLVALVVSGRVVPDAEQSLKRNELLPEQPHVTG